jgi:hypothetical protein
MGPVRSRSDPATKSGRALAPLRLVASTPEITGPVTTFSSATGSSHDHPVRATANGLPVADTLGPVRAGARRQSLRTPSLATGPRVKRPRPRRDRIALPPATPSPASVAIEIVVNHASGPVTAWRMLLARSICEAAAARASAFVAKQSPDQREATTPASPKALIRSARHRALAASQRCHLRRARTILLV